VPIPPDNRAPGDSGHITDHHDIADELTAITAGAVALAGDLTGTAGAAQVTGTHLGSPLPLAQGGTGQSAQAAALTALAGTQTAGKVVRSDGTNTALASLQASDVPTLNQSTTGTAAGLSATLPVASGGTGQTSQQAAIDALTGAQSAGKVVRSDGTHATLASLQAGDVPALNQNTTGTAAGLSSTLAVSSGGTGQTSAPNALNALGGAAVAGDIGGTSASPQVTGTHLASALPVAQGGTGSTSRNFAGLLTPTAVKTSAYTLAAGDFVPCDTTSGNVPLTLPNAPADLAVCAAKQVIQGTGNKVTVACSGSDVFNKVGGGVTATLDTLAQGQVYQYKAGSPGIWYITADDLSLSQLDARYTQPGSSAPAQVTGHLGNSAGVAPTAARTDHRHAFPSVFLNAIEWGCVADGVTNNLTAINNMLSAAAIYAGTYCAGGTQFTKRIPLYFPYGGASNYAISGAPIVLPNYQLIFGDGAWNTGIQQLTPSTDTIQINPGGFPGLGRTDAGCVTNSTATVSDVQVQAVDLGKSVTGSGIPAGTYVISVTLGTGFVMSQAASTGITVSLVIGSLTTRIDTGCVLNSTATVGDTLNTVTTADIGNLVTGSGIPASTHILSVTPGTGFVMTAPATTTLTTPLTISLYRDEMIGYVFRDISIYGAGVGTGRTDTGVTYSSASQVVTDSTATTTDIGSPVTASWLPSGVFIVMVAAGNVTLSANPMSSGTGSMTVGEGIGINVWNAPQIDFQRVKVGNCGSHGIQTQYSWDILGEHLVCSGNGGNGLVAQNQVNLLNLVSPEFTANGIHGLCISTGAAISVSNPDVESNQCHGIYAPFSFALTVTGGDFEGNNKSNNGYANIFAGSSSVYDIGPYICGNNFSEGCTAYSLVGSASNGGVITAIASWSSPSAGVIAVSNGALFPNPAGTGGLFSVVTSTGVATCTYAGVSGNTLTGCTYVSGSPTGTVATNAYIGANGVANGIVIDTANQSTITGNEFSSQIRPGGADILINSGAHGTQIGPNASFNAPTGTTSPIIIDNGVGTVLAGQVHRPAALTLAYSSTVTINAGQGNIFTIPLAGNVVLANPLNPTANQEIFVRLIQPASGGPCTASFGTAFHFSTDLPVPTLTTTASGIDYLKFIYNATTSLWDMVGIVQGF
jgi:hypothetical protein